MQKGRVMKDKHQIEAEGAKPSIPSLRLFSPPSTHVLLVWSWIDHCALFFFHVFLLWICTNVRET